MSIKIIKGTIFFDFLIFSFKKKDTEPVPSVTYTENAVQPEG